MSLFKKQSNTELRLTTESPVSIVIKPKDKDTCFFLLRNETGCRLLVRSPEPDASKLQPRDA